MPSNPSSWAHLLSWFFCSRKWRHSHSKWFCLGFFPLQIYFFVLNKFNLSFCIRSISHGTQCTRIFSETSFSLGPQLPVPSSSVTSDTLSYLHFMGEHTAKRCVCACIIEVPMYCSPSFPMLCIFFLFSFLKRLIRILCLFNMCWLCQRAEGRRLLVLPPMPPVKRAPCWESGSASGVPVGCG